MDHGVANYPQDGDQSDQLIHVADERLYRLKHANHSRGKDSTPVRPPAQQTPAYKPVPITATTEVPAPDRSLGLPVLNHPLANPIELPEAPALYEVQRKAERVSMAGTNAYAIIGDLGARRARVLDLGFGGVASSSSSPRSFPKIFLPYCTCRSFLPFAST